MSFPVGLPTTLVTYTAANPAGGGPATGTVTFAPTVPAVVVDGYGTVFSGRGLYRFDAQGRLVDGTGAVGVRLLPNDVPGSNPAGWVWMVTVAVTGAPQRTYYVSVSQDQAAVDLRDLEQLDPARATYVAVPGPAGLTGPEGVAGATGATGPQGATGPAGPQPPLGAAGAGDTIALMSTDPTTTNSRTPTGHQASHATGGTDPLTPGAIGAETPAGATSKADAAVAGHVAATDPHGDRAYADGKFQPQVLATISSLLATNPFYVAHRGSGGEFPEHTMASYASTVGAGAKAIEVSVHCSADGVLFCMHDSTLDRMTNSTWTGSHTTWTWAALNQRAKIVGVPLLGPGWADQPIPTVREVLDRYVGKTVIWLEAKGNSAVTPLQNLILTYPGATKSVAWKAYYLSTSLTWAKSNGFKVWAYTDPATTQAQMDAVDANVDYWGVPWESTDAQITAVVGRAGGKAVMVWEVHRRSEVARLTGLGVKGIMCSQYLYATRSTAGGTADDFFTQVKAPGNIGAVHSDPAAAMKWDTGAGTSVVYLNKLGGAALSLGWFCPVVPGTNGYKITWDMMFPVVPASSLHAGIYFGKAADDMYTFSSTANTSGGYHMLLRGAGDMQFYKHAAGVASGTQLDTVLTATPVAGGWMSFEAEVNATQVVLRRIDGTAVVRTVANTDFRGGYFGLHNGSLTDTTTAPRWRNVKVVAL